jgi:SPOR domain
MITVRAGKGAIGFCLLLLASGCSREQQDWRSAEAADTIEAYGQFIQRHPDSELATEARTRVAQLGEDRDWQHAGSADTVEAYREFIAQHPSGKWTQEARIRIENFSLSEQKGTDAAVTAGNGGAPGGGPTGSAGGGAAGPPRGPGLAVPGEAAVPVAQPGHLASSAAPAVGSGSAVAPGRGTVMAPGPGSAMASGASRPASGGFGVQLGAFSSEAGANNEWRALTGRFAPELQGLSQHVVPAETASGRIYRLQALVGDEARARAICDSLRKRGQACVAVLPH